MQVPSRRARRTLWLPAIWLSTSIAAGAASPLSLNEAVELAEAGQPLLTGQLAGVRAAEDTAVAARQLPDPKLKLGLLNVPVSGPDAWSLTNDFMTMRMVGVTQEFPRESKRQLKSELAMIEGQQRRQELAFTRRAIKRDTSLAWLDAWYAQRTLQVSQAVEREIERQIDASSIAVRAAKATPADVLSARIELGLAKDRASAQQQRDEAARAELSRWIGEAAQRPLPGELPVLPTPPPLETLIQRLAEHPHLSTYEKQELAAEKEAQLARKSTLPDWNLELGYAFRGSAYSNMVSVQIGIDLPLFQKNRQLRDYSAKLALADRARAMREDNLREMQAMVRRAYVEWNSTNERLDRYRSSLLPQAAARTESALAGYRAGRGELSKVLEARRMELDLRMQQLMLEADAARAQIQIAYYHEEAR
jgi:outer membrane protein TolC